MWKGGLTCKNCCEFTTLTWNCNVTYKKTQNKRHQKPTASSSNTVLKWEEIALRCGEETLP